MGKLGDEDERTLVDLLVEQIEFANVILLNKIDLISSEELKTVHEYSWTECKSESDRTNHSKVDREITIQLFNSRKHKIIHFGHRSLPL